MNKLTALLIYILLGCPLLSNAQHGDANTFAQSVDFLSPPPNAYSFNKKEILGLNKNNGTVSVNIPIYTVVGKKLSLPINLSYASNGIRVDEQASRSGMGWVLENGGVITRIVRGSPDESATRIAPAAAMGYNWASYHFMQKVALNDGKSNLDAEPDLFSVNFPGFSGSFILDANMKPVMLNASNVKIEFNFFADDWNFKITDGNGVSYFFGGNTATEKSKRLTTYGKSFSIFTATAWYLKKIKNINGEEINFTYTPLNYFTYDSVAESMEYGNNTACHENTYITNITRNKNYSSIQGVLLNEIITDNYALIRFTYQDRLSGQDKLIKKIGVYNKRNNQLIKNFTFDYDNYLPNPIYSTPLSVNEYIPYLNSVKESSADSLINLKHVFTYIHPENRPPRLSFSQDHYGYFNGEINASFTPYTEAYADIFPNASAKRDPNPNFSKNGLLSVIQYPTGAKDSISYEPNVVQSKFFPWPSVFLNDDVVGTGVKNIKTKEISFSVDQGQFVKLDISTLCTDPENATHQVIGRVEISRNSVFYLQKSFAINTNEQIKLWLDAGTYKIVLSAAGEILTTNFLMEYKPIRYPLQDYDKILGGLRVKAIETIELNQKINTKKYFYGSISNMNSSSATEVNQPTYIKAYTSGYYYNTGGGAEATRPIICIPCPTNHILLESNSLLNLFNYGAGTVSYRTVIEGRGEDFENGLTETNYSVGADLEAQHLWGDNQLLSGALTNNSLVFGNGKVIGENHYKVTTGNVFKPVKSTYYHYKNDSRKSFETSGYFASCVFQPSFVVDTAVNTVYIEAFLKGFTLKKYDISAIWSYNDTTVTKTYDLNGLNPIINTVVNYFDDVTHLQNTRTTTVNSEGKVKSALKQYPANFPTIYPYNQMINSNKIEIPIIESVSVDNQKVNESKYVFDKIDNNDYVMKEFDMYFKGEGLVKMGEIKLYDASGNILEYKAKDDMNVVTIWSYNQSLPIAQIKNATYATIENLLGGATAVSIFSSSDPTAAQVNSFLAPLRSSALLKSAQVTTYTYKPLVGISTQTDAKEITTYYEYDELQRLKQIRDQYENIIKSYQYHYKP